jgi:hypothetical protein
MLGEAGLKTRTADIEPVTRLDRPEHYRMRGRIRKEFV